MTVPELVDQLHAVLGEELHDLALRTALRQWNIARWRKRILDEEEAVQAVPT